MVSSRLGAGDAWLEHRYMARRHRPLRPWREVIRAFIREPAFRSLLVAAAIVLLVGTVFYHYVEGWSWVDSLYFCTITLTTIGYGDFAPTTEAGRLFTIAYVLVGIGIITTFISAMASARLFSDDETPAADAAGPSAGSWPSKRRSRCQQAAAGASSRRRSRVRRVRT